MAKYQTWILFRDEVENALAGRFDAEGDCPLYSAFDLGKAPGGVRFWCDVVDEYEARGGKLGATARAILELELKNMDAQP